MAGLGTVLNREIEEIALAAGLVVNSAIFLGFEGLVTFAIVSAVGRMLAI